MFTFTEIEASDIISNVGRKGESQTIVTAFANAGIRTGLFNEAGDDAVEVKRVYDNLYQWLRSPKADALGYKGIISVRLNDGKLYLINSSVEPTFKDAK